ncbi:hypothetical protein K4L44_04940 [Halosquirtibacter laminarini]|uniref:Uncharacterized protein n=1 Tax=Halosquirtibacter laminarini TaxID=3374600 RepID=A0AC61NNU6_9BACT|nr:hypothetical protein K4L44_04940 [Prolixibacteraceae bacterium]
MTRFAYFLNKTVEEFISTILGLQSYEIAGCGAVESSQYYHAFRSAAAGAGLGSCVGTLAKGSKGKEGGKKKK